MAIVYYNVEYRIVHSVAEQLICFDFLMIYFSFYLHFLKSLILWQWLCIYRNEGDGSSKVDVIEEVEDQASTMKKRGKKEKKKKKDHDNIEDLAEDVNHVTVEQGRKDKQQSKVSVVCVHAYM